MTRHGAGDAIVETERPVTVTFGDGELLTFDGCNSHTYTYELGDGIVAVGGGPGTQIVCTPRVAEQAKGVTEILTSSPTAIIEDGGLVLTSVAGELRLREGSPSK